MEGASVVVTGAAGALGLAVTRVLANSGWRVVGIDLGNEPAASEAALFLPGRDLTSTEQTATTFAEVRRFAPSLSALVNVAGGFAWARIDSESLSVWDRLYDMNVRTALNACVAGVALMSRGAAIVNVGAMASLKAEGGMGPYSASKAAVARLTESLAAELRPRRVRVNALLPSIIDTPANRAAMPSARFEDWVQPEAIAEVIAFLISERARAINGALVPVT